MISGNDQLLGNPNETNSDLNLEGKLIFKHKKIAIFFRVSF